MCVQVWVVCLSADGRPYSGGWLRSVFVLVLALVFVVVCFHLVGVVVFSVFFVIYFFHGQHVSLYVC